MVRGILVRCIAGLVGCVHFAFQPQRTGRTSQDR